MALADVVDNVRDTLDDLNPRERRLLVAMAAVFAVLVTILPFYLVLSKVGSMEQENEDIVAVLQDIARARDRLQAARAEQQAVDRLYSRKAPALGSFLEERASEKGVEGLDVTDQPELTMGAYSRRSVRVSMSRVQLRPFIEMLAEIKNSRYPVAIAAIQLDGARRGGDHSARITVNAYDSATAEEEVE